VLGKVAAYAEWRVGAHGIIPDFDDINPASARETCRKAIEERGAGWLSQEEVRAVLAAIFLPVAPGGRAPRPTRPPSWPATPGSTSR